MAKKSVKKKVSKKKAVKKVSRAKPKTAKKNVVRKKSSVKAMKPQKVRRVRSSSRKMVLVVKNLLFYLILFALSIVLYSGSTEDVYVSLFMILSIIFGVLSLAFLIVFLILALLKILKR